jgi:putative isomerase
LDTELTQHAQAIREYLHRDYEQMYREPGGTMKHGFLTPGSAQYADVLWDWDAWLSNVALRQIVAEADDPQAAEKALPYEQGCILNFLDFSNLYGEIPVAINRDKEPTGLEEPGSWTKKNNHKPCLAQHAAFIVKQMGGDADWLAEKFQFMHFFMNNYRSHRRHEPTGLYFWVKTGGIGVDNDPCTYYRPLNSDASIYLNCFMVKELEAMIYLCERLKQTEVADHYRKDLADLKAAIQEHCWDEWGGAFFSADLALRPIEHDTYSHRGMPRDYDCLVNRRLIWSIFLALWAGVADEDQARRMVEEHYRDERTFFCDWGVRTLGKLEKMYNVRPSGNPSSWLGPIWGASNYLTFRGLVRYGFDDDARDLAEKTVRLLGRDIQRTGAMHEYYQPENGEPLLNHGFQNWNMLVLNMIHWLEGGEPIWEF